MSTRLPLYKILFKTPKTVRIWDILQLLDSVSTTKDEQKWCGVKNVGSWYSFKWRQSKLEGWQIYWGTRMSSVIISTGLITFFEFAKIFKTNLLFQDIGEAARFMNFRASGKPPCVNCWSLVCNIQYHLFTVASRHINELNTSYSLWCLGFSNLLLALDWTFVLVSVSQISEERHSCR